MGRSVRCSGPEKPPAPAAAAPTGMIKAERRWISNSTRPRPPPARPPPTPPSTVAQFTHWLRSVGGWSGMDCMRGVACRHCIGDILRNSGCIVRISVSAVCLFSSHIIQCLNNCTMHRGTFRARVTRMRFSLIPPATYHRKWVQ